MIRTETVQAEARPSVTTEGMSALLVLLLTALALAGGLLLRNSVLTRTAAVTDPSGVAIRYPADWQVGTPTGQNGIVQVRDLTSRGYNTMVEVRGVTVDPAAEDPSVLGLVANDLIARRGAELTAFKLFNLSADSSVNGLPAARMRYAFVEVPEGLQTESSPQVVLGDDYLVRRGDKVYIFSLHSAEANRASALPVFERLVTSAQLP